jgi:hypothetical protein
MDGLGEGVLEELLDLVLEIEELSDSRKWWYLPVLDDDADHLINRCTMSVELLFDGDDLHFLINSDCVLDGLLRTRFIVFHDALFVHTLRKPL